MKSEMKSPLVRIILFSVLSALAFLTDAKADPASGDVSYFHQWQPAVSFPLSEFNAGTNNQFELRIGPLIPITQGTHPAYTPVYSVTFRIYYEAKAKPHPTGKVIAPAAGSALGETVDLAASASSPNGAVTRIDFLGHYEGLNYEGDRAYLRWHGGLKQGALTNYLGSTDTLGNKVV